MSAWLMGVTSRTECERKGPEDGHSQVGASTFWMYWVPGRPLSISLNMMLGYSPEKASITGFFTILNITCHFKGNIGLASAERQMVADKQNNPCCASTRKTGEKPVQRQREPLRSSALPKEHACRFPANLPQWPFHHRCQKGSNSAGIPRDPASAQTTTSSSNTAGRDCYCWSWAAPTVGFVCFGFFF
jgi:hypothetical protein